MDFFQKFFALATTLLYLHSNVAYCEEVLFYDDDGSVFTLTISGGCYNFKPKWDRRATAVDIERGCFNVWDSPDCKGQHLRLGRNEGASHDLKKQRFGNAVRSVNMCSPDQQDRHHGSSNGNRNTGSRPDIKQPPSLSLKEIQEIAVAEHNKYRKMHGVPDIHGDPTIHADAQKHAEHLATTNKFETTTMGGKYGTNLASSFRRDKAEAVKDAIKRWYDKGKYYDYDRPGYNVGGQSTGSFTAIVWKSTTLMGIGVAWNEAEEGYIINAFYSPAANMKSKFRENVLPPVSRTG